MFQKDLGVRNAKIYALEFAASLSATHVVFTDLTVSARNGGLAKGLAFRCPSQ